MNQINIVCPYCQRTLSVICELAGQQAVCPQCGNTITVPTAFPQNCNMPDAPVFTPDAPDVPGVPMVPVPGKTAMATNMKIIPALIVFAAVAVAVYFFFFREDSSSGSSGGGNSSLSNDAVYAAPKLDQSSQRAFVKSYLRAFLCEDIESLWMLTSPAVKEYRISVYGSEAQAKVELRKVMFTGETKSFVSSQREVCKNEKAFDEYIEKVLQLWRKNGTIVEVDGKWYINSFG